MALEKDRSVSELLQDIVTDVQQIIRSEVLLAKTELREKALRASKAGRLVAVGAVAALYAVGFLLLFCVYALAMAIASWAAALIVALGVGIAAAVLLRVGIKRMRQVSPTPQKTIEGMKENVRWAKNQTK
jgi:Flp pilus assembly protein TadB